jgi:acyl carrier protein
MQKEAIRSTVFSVMAEVARDAGVELRPGLSDATNLFETGLDSLGFAIVIAHLEERLHHDPFAAVSRPVYPQTLGDFISLYLREDSDGQR